MARPELPPELVPVRPQLLPLDTSDDNDRRGRTRRTAAAGTEQPKQGPKPGVMSTDAQAYAAIHVSGAAGENEDVGTTQKDGSFDSNRGQVQGGGSDGRPSAPTIIADNTKEVQEADGDEAKAGEGAKGPAVLTEEVDVSPDPIGMEAPPATVEQHAQSLVAQGEGLEIAF